LNVPKLLIDGYNLLFESNLVGRGRGRNWLPNARNRLVQLLSERLSATELSNTRIVFDAPKFGSAPQRESLPSGMAIEYAVNHAEADDLLEEIIRRHPTPKQLTVVSSDHRIRACARSRRAVSLGSQQFLDELERAWNSKPAAVAPPEGSEESQPLSASEVEFWLKEFEQRSEPS
jgi:predicted RNA-binding protein with PIN domain